MRLCFALEPLARLGLSLSSGQFHTTALYLCHPQILAQGDNGKMTQEQTRDVTVPGSHGTSATEAAKMSPTYGVVPHDLTLFPWAHFCLLPVLHSVSSDQGVSWAHVWWDGMGSWRQPYTPGNRKSFLVLTTWLGCLSSKPQPGKSFLGLSVALPCRSSAKGFSWCRGTVSTVLVVGHLCLPQLPPSCGEDPAARDGR